MKGLFSSTAVENIIQKYIDKGGEAIQTDEGVLGMGNWVCKGQNLKTAVIKEVYLNEWSSSHSVMMYNKCPKKYENVQL